MNPREVPAVSPPAVEVRDLWLSLGGRLVLEGIDLQLPERAFLGVIGPNGAGKTVFLKTLVGLHRPDRGTVRIFGKPIDRTKGEVAYVPQFASFDQEFPIRVLDVVLMGRLGRRAILRRYGQDDRERAFSALERVNLAGLADRQIGKLSGGELQRVLVARALCVEARLLLLDEPTASLDTPIASALYALLGELSSRMTVILVSHDVGVMYRHIKTVACLNRRLVYHKTKEITQEMLEETYGAPVDLVVHPHTHRVLDEHPELP